MFEIIKKITIPFFIIDLILVVEFIIHFGFLWFFLEAIASFIIGCYAIKLAFKKVFFNFSYISDSIFAMAAFLLILPGILTDIIAIILFIYFFITRILVKKEKIYETNNNYKESEIIDVDVIEEDNKGLK